MTETLIELEPTISDLETVFSKHPGWSLRIANLRAHLTTQGEEIERAVYAISQARGAHGLTLARAERAEDEAATSHLRIVELEEERQGLREMLQQSRDCIALTLGDRGGILGRIEKALHPKEDEVRTSQPLSDAGPIPRCPKTQHSDGGEQ